jgi:PRC-barrel domain protein
VNQVDPGRLVGARLVGPGEKRIGKIGLVLLDDRSGAPYWVTVRTGLFGCRTRFVPLSAARVRRNGDIEVPYPKDQVRDAPPVKVDDGHISEAEQASLYRHYGSEQAGVGPDAGEVSAEARHRGRTERRPVGDADRHVRGGGRDEGTGQGGTSDDD